MRVTALGAVLPPAGSVEPGEVGRAVDRWILGRESVIITRKEAPMDFNSILIGSEDPQRLVDYYTRLFGVPGFSDGGYSGWQIGSGYLTVGPHSEVKGRNVHPGRIIWNIETSDVKGEFGRLVAAGAIVVREPYSFEGMPDTWIATLADPDDNYFQLMSPMTPEATTARG